VTLATVAQPAEISVIIPAFNGARFLASAIESIVLQEWPNLEVILVDDGSDDDLDIAAQQLAMPVRYMRQERRGPAAARNVGVRHSQAPLIAFLDIDDTWTAGHLSRLHAVLVLHPEAGIAQGRMQQFTTYSDGRTILSGAYLFPHLGTCLFRRQVLERMGGIDEGMQLGEDYDLIFRCWEADIEKVCVDEVSLLYRRHPGNITRGRHTEGPVAIAHRRLQRIRSGIVDPKAPHAMPFKDYSGNIDNFWKDQVEITE
jgi:glycosyltransferase involved in cell wall biosynthesis